MKKIILSVLMLGVMLGMVSAASFVYPSVEGGENVSGNVNIEWNNSEGTNGLYLQYNDCGEGIWTNLNSAFDGDVTTYPWDTEDEEEGASDGDYCLRLEGWNLTFAETAPFTIDNTDPTAEFTYDGILIVGEDIEFNAIDSYDENNIETFAWDFGDGSDEVIGAEDLVYYTYSEAGTYEVVLTVTDYAGNQDTATEQIVIEPIIAEDTFSFEAGILGIRDLGIDEELGIDDSFETGMEDVTCEFVSPEVLEDDDNLIDINGDGSSCTLDWVDIPYKYRGINNWVVKVTDADDYVEYFEVEITVYTWMIDLEEGWNLISIPMMPEDTSVESVFSNIYENVADEGYSVFQYDPTYQYGWYRTKKSDGGFYASSRELTAIVPGYGYYLNMDAEDTLKGIGSIAPEREGPMLSVDVANGWNLIGHYGLFGFEEGEPIGMLYEEALTSLIMGPFEWETSYYDAVVSDDVGYMEAYKGYWMTGKGIYETMSYTPSQIVIDYILNGGA